MRAKNMVVVPVVVLASADVFSIYLLSRPERSHAMPYAFTGYVLEVNPELNRITVRNADIPGIMTSMVMDYRVKDARALAGIKQGDTTQGTMVMDGGYWLEHIKVTGKRP